MAADDRPLLPVKPGDWVTDDRRRCAKVRSCYIGDGEVLVDLVLYDVAGNRIGRQSPAEGGPTKFEPAMSYSSWRRMQEPHFPIKLAGIERGGRIIMDWDFGPTIADRKWRAPRRRSVLRTIKTDDEMRKALRDIADGHNDPRRRAAEALGRR